MKRLVLFITIALMLLTGCSSSAYETYVKALEKTEAVSSGKMKMTQEIQIEFNTDGVDEKVLKELKKWEEFNIDMRCTFDNEQEKSVADLYGEFYDIGIEGKLYGEKDNLYVVTPLLPKILVLNSDDLELEEELAKWEKQFLATNFENFEKLWKEVIHKEKVSKLGNIIISTPEGDIKSKEFNIALTKEDLMPLMIEGIEMFNERMMEQMKVKNVDIDREEIEEKFKKAMKEIDFEKIHHRAYIDRDGFVVEEETHLIINFPSEQGGHIKSMDFKLKSQNWELGKDVDIIMPKLTDENSMTIEELKDSSFSKQFKGGE